MASRPAGLRGSVLPSTVYSSTAPDDAVLSSDVYTIEDAKQHLNIELDDNADDSRLAAMVSECLGELEALSGRRFSLNTRVAEYSDQACKWCVASIPSPGVVTVTSVVKVSSTGTETTMSSSDYEVVYRNGRPMVRILDDTNAFDAGSGVLAKITYTSKLDINSRAAQVARGIMNELVEYSFADTQESRHDPRTRKSFQRALAVLADKTGVRVASQ